MATTDFDKMISLVNSIEAETKRQSEALEITTAAMKDAALEANEVIHYIKGLSEKPLTQGERVVIERLRGIFKTLSDASIEAGFKVN